jgi:hypothetical protein
MMKWIVALLLIAGCTTEPEGDAWYTLDDAPWDASGWIATVDCGERPMCAGYPDECTLRCHVGGPFNVTCFCGGVFTEYPYLMCDRYSSGPDYHWTYDGVVLGDMRCTLASEPSACVFHDYLTDTAGPLPAAIGDVLDQVEP